MAKALRRVFQQSPSRQYHAQMAFLRAVQSEFPAVLEDLRKSALERYRASPYFASKARKKGWSFKHFSSSRHAPDRALLNCLNEWAGRNSLTPEWCLEQALTALRGWSRGSQRTDWNFSLIIFMAETPLPPEEFTMSIDMVDPRTFTDSMAWGSAEAAFREQFHEYWERQKERAMLAGYSKTSVVSMDHFRWLALYLIGGLSAGEIRNEAKASAGTDNEVSRAVRRAANLIDIPLPNRQGRPRKTKHILDQQKIPSLFRRTRE